MRCKTPPSSAPNCVGPLWVWACCCYYCYCTVTSACQYSQFSPSHTMCVYKGPGCPLLKRGVSASEAALIVDTHNRLRQKVANGQEQGAGGQPSASNMRQMEWDEELALAAQKWAEQCKTQHDCPDCRRVPRFRVGQNVYMFASSEDNSSSDWPATLKEWYDEVAIFKTSQINPFRHTPATGHYSQFVWADTYKIGCGWAYYKKGIWFSKLYVCDYGPGGNILSTEMYSRGQSCSLCPDNSTCSQQYEGLCSAATLSQSGWPPAWRPSTVATENRWWQRTTSSAPVRRVADSRPLLVCDFDSKGCRVDTMGTGRWTVQRGTDNYYEVKVRPGENAHLYLYASDRGPMNASSAQACLGFRYRKYPQSSRTLASDSAQLQVLLWKRGQHEAFSEVKFAEAARTWSPHRVTVPVDPLIFAVSFHLNADSSLGSAQYLSLDDVILQEGPCS